MHKSIVNANMSNDEINKIFDDMFNRLNIGRDVITMKMQLQAFRRDWDTCKCAFDKRASIVVTPEMTYEIYNVDFDETTQMHIYIVRNDLMRIRTMCAKNRTALNKMIIAL